MNLLVIDDDVELCKILRELLEESGYCVECESHGEHGLRRTLTESFDLLILDVTLPGSDGFEVLRRVREHSQIPVLMLSAKANRWDRVTGLREGADDYLTKPFYPEELLARVQAILRRGKGAAKTAVAPPQPIQIGELRLQPASRDVYFRQRRLDLTAMEVEILECLMRSFGSAVSRDRLSLLLYNRLPAPFDRTIDTHVSRIRRKLGEARRMILSVRGTGYQIRTLAGPESR
jgi:two-component system, OmpR family, response regulator